MKFNSAVFAALVAVLFPAFAGRAQTTAFTYQGQLSSSNAPASGLYDFRFRLFDVNSNVVAGPLTNSPAGVTNGVFIVTLNFGGAVFSGSDRWLEIAVRSCGDTNAYTALSPRQQITSVPYAIRAIYAANASNAVALTAPLQGTNIIGTIRATNLPPNVAFLNSNQVFTASDAFNGVVTANNSANAFSGAFTGNGGGLTNVPATSLAGTLPDAQLSANVALQSNPNLSFAGAVSATNFTGAGHGLTNVPGAFFWVTVAGTSSQIYPNVGYIATNNTAPVILTLPSSPGVGDVYKVAGVGAGGWIIAQNANQMVAAGNLSDAVGQSWKTNSPVANWSAIASSADGTKLAATVYGDYIYTSANSGATWTKQNGNNNASGYWSSIASSADGTKLVATVGYTIHNTSPVGYIYTSTDSGATWSPRFGSARWSSSASSADGTKLVAAIHDSSNGYIYTSTDSGATWSPRSVVAQWSSVASSVDGTKLAAAVDGGYIYTSTNSGVNWTQQTGSSGQAWSALASSSDGARLVATTTGGAVYVSMDSGVTWIAQNSPNAGQLTSIASSSDGARLATTKGGGSAGNIFGSSNSGATWTQLAGAPSLPWSAIVSSADGSLLAAAAYGGNIYLSSQSSTTTGAAGYLIGSQHSAIELIYVGNNLFLPLNHEGTIRAY
ncbi:MAG: sialidase family protein [Verrucomicrobiota bacterium]